MGGQSKVFENFFRERPKMSQPPPQSYGPNQPQGYGPNAPQGWNNGPQPTFYGSGGGAQLSEPKTSPVLAIATMGAGALALVGSSGPWAVAKAFGREQSATGLQSDGWGVTALLLSIGIIAVAGAVAFVPAVKQLTWPMFVVAGLGLVNLIISIVVASNVQSVNVVGLVQAGMGWGLILLLIASIAVIALAVVQALQTLKAAKNAHPFPPSSGGMGNPYQGGGQPQGYQNQGPSGAHYGPQGYPH